MDDDSMNNPCVSFVILNYKTKELVRECVKNIYRSRIIFPFEIIVVDNSRDEGLETMLEERYEQVTYIPIARNVGCAAGNNIGINVAKGKYIIISNADVTIFPSTIETLFQYMEQQSDVGIIGPRLLNPDGTLQESFYRFYQPLTPIYRRLWIGRLHFAKKHIESFLMKDVSVREYVDVDQLMGAFLFVRKSAIEKVGNFDERFFLYFSDTDWCMRFWLAGYRVVYHNDVTLVHLHKRQSAEKMGLRSLNDPITRIHIFDGIRYFLKYRMNYERPKITAK